jgi:DNA-binding IclR family transcriptional regulator
MPTVQAHEVTGRYVERVTDLLIALGEGPPDGMGVSALAGQVKLSKSTVHRLLQTLRRRGFVSYVPGVRKYRLGARIIGLGLRAQQRLEIIVDAFPILYDLRDQTGETTGLCVPVGQWFVPLAQAVTHRMPRGVYPLGRFEPLHLGATGLVLLAFHDNAFIDRYLAEVPLTSESRFAVTDAAELRQQLERVRQQGYAIVMGGKEGFNGLAFPLFNGNEHLLGAISFYGPSDRWTVVEMERHIPACQARINELQLRLRHMAPPAF